MADYPEDCIQFLADGPWWIERRDGSLCEGRLVQAYIPYVERDALAIRVNGRTAPTEHGGADIRVERLDVAAPPPPPAIPVAGFPHFRGEIYMVQRAKLRPAIVVSVEPPLVSMPKASPSWQSAQTAYVAPAYGCDQDGGRGGWDPSFLKRVRECRYPQYMLDKIPLPGSEWSVIRFDQIQPIGRNHRSMVVTDYCLGGEAIGVVRDWVTWILTGQVVEDGAIDIFQEQMASLGR